MVVIALWFPAKRFHATPWGRQVNEGAVEWPPSPWRLLRSLIAVWHHKFPDVPAEDARELIEQLAAPPRFYLPPASQGHTRHYMPTAGGDKTKIFDTFVAVAPQEKILAVWPEVELLPAQRDLLQKLLAAMTYFGRAESWVVGKLLDEPERPADVEPLELGQEPPPGSELVRTLVPLAVDEHAAWHAQTYEQQRGQKLSELMAAALAKGKPTSQVKLSKKDERQLEQLLPKTLFDALHADTAELRKAGWNQPPGSRWIHYARKADAFSSTQASAAPSGRRQQDRPTVARFAVCGKVRPRLTEALLIGERARAILMGCSKNVRADDNAAEVFSGKRADGTRLDQGHRHAHFLCESAADDGKISHLTVFAPRGFDPGDETALQRFAQAGIWGKDGYDMQLVLLGIGRPEDFGGTNEKAGQSPLLATSAWWHSRTPLVPTRHLKVRRSRFSDAAQWEAAVRDELCEMVRLELSHREQFADVSPQVEIELMPQAGTELGGHFTSWLKFRRDRRSGSGAKAGVRSYGFRLRFPRRVTGPIALGYGCHFGLGVFIADQDAAGA